MREREERYMRERERGERERERKGGIQPRVTYCMQSGAEISPSILPSIPRCGCSLAVCIACPLSLSFALSLSLFPLTLIFSSAAAHDVTLCSLDPPPSSLSLCSPSIAATRVMEAEKRHRVFPHSFELYLPALPHILK